MKAIKHAVGRQPCNDNPGTEPEPRDGGNHEYRRDGRFQEHDLQRLRDRRE
jgi:hypothetical protein